MALYLLREVATSKGGGCQRFSDCWWDIGGYLRNSTGDSCNRALRVWGASLCMVMLRVYHARNCQQRSA